MLPFVLTLFSLPGEERRHEGEASEEEDRGRVRPAKRRHRQDQDPAGGKVGEEAEEEQGVQICQRHRGARFQQRLI